MNSSKFKQHLTSKHLRLENNDSVAVLSGRQTTLKELGLKEQYISARVALLKSIIFNYMPFSAVAYYCVKNQFHLLHCHPPKQTTVTNDITKCAFHVIDMIKARLKECVTYSVVSSKKSGVYEGRPVMLVLVNIVEVLDTLSAEEED